MTDAIDRPLPLIIAHRGARDEAPENTGAAFDRALAYPVDGLELDVQMSRDGVPMVYHDRTLHRISGMRRRVCAVDAADLLSMDGGRWFGGAFEGEPLLTLAQVLDRYLHRTRLLIEIKSRRRDRTHGWSLQLTRKTFSLFRDPAVSRHSKNILLLSFDLAVLEEAARLAPEIERVWNLPETVREFEKIVLKYRSHPSQLGHIAGLGVKLNRLSGEVVALAHEQGMPLLTYTCNQPAQVRKALALGADIILTDRPGWMTAFLKKNRQFV